MSIQVLLHRFRWLHLPTSLLVMLLQRTPVLRLLSAEGPAFGLQSADILKSAFALAALGAYNSVTGATTFNATVVSPTTVTPSSAGAFSTFTVASPSGSAFSIGVSGSGAPSTIKSWKVTGTFPSGLSVANGTTTTGGYIYNGLKVTISGTPSAAASANLTLTAYDQLNASGNNANVRCAITISSNVTVPSDNTVPSFTTSPSSQTVNYGSSVTLVSEAAGVPAPTYAWRKNGALLPGQTSANLTFAAVALTDAGNYTVTATNSAAPAGVAATPATLAVVVPPPATLADPGTLRSGSTVSWDLSGGQPIPAGLAYGSSKLPAGLALNTLDGHITGTITAAAGNYTFTTWAQVGAVKSAIQTVSLVVGAFPGSLAGSYEALLDTTGGTPFPAGKLSLLVAPAGTFTGVLTTDDLAAFKLKGRLSLAADNASGSATLVLVRKTPPSYTLDVTVAAAAPFVTATLSGGNTTLGVSSDGARLAGVAPANAAGPCTVLFAEPANLGSVAESPIGIGSATGVIAATGAIKLTGVTADGVKFTASLPIGADNTYRLYAKPYKLAGGYLAGPLPLTPRSDDATRWHVTPADGASVYWRKPAPAVVVPNYGQGFGPIGLTARLEPWIAPSANSTLSSRLGLDGSGNFTVTVKATGVDSANVADPYGLPDTLHLSALNALSVVGANTTLFTGKLNLATGALTGGFTLPAVGPTPKRSVTYSGALLQPAPEDKPGLIGGGFFLLPPAVSGGPVYSGQVELSTP